jgi:hypothetical protein
MKDKKGKDESDGIPSINWFDFGKWLDEAKKANPSIRVNINIQ